MGPEELEHHDATEVLVSGSIHEVVQHLLLRLEPDLSWIRDLPAAREVLDQPAGTLPGREGRLLLPVPGHPLRSARKVALEQFRPWTISLTRGFTKAAEKLDKQMQGRLLVALMVLCDSPDTPRGDTIKPLEGERSGDWRYRIGDYRLVYRPDRSRREVLVLDVASRGGVYG